MYLMYLIPLHEVNMAVGYLRSYFNICTVWPAKFIWNELKLKLFTRYRVIK